MTDGATAPVPAFASISELRRAHEQLLDDLDRQLDQLDAASSETAVFESLEPQIRAFIEQGAATGTFLAEVNDRTAAQVLIDFWVSSLARAATGSPPSRLAPFDAARAPELPDQPCPYVGLDAFRDPSFFFGREVETQSLVGRVDGSRLVVVIGASGSGKSSLVMGGVLPALAQRQGEAVIRIAPPIVPSNAVLVRLARAVRQASGGSTGDSSAEGLRLLETPDALTALAGGEDAPATLITIDQFEEVFTLVERPEREALAKSLASFLGNERHRVILTMREEFRSRLVELRDLTDFLTPAAWYSVPPMGYEELRAAVERPAEAVNLQFESGIVDDVVKRVLGQPAALPLLQFTLKSLWDRRTRNRITWDVYRNDVGDPLAALQKSADRFFDAQPRETQDEVKRILLELVRVDDLLEAYRQPLRKRQLLDAGKANTETVLGMLVKEDFVALTEDDDAVGDALVEVKHESLVRNWPQLVSWIDGKRIDRRQRIALSQAAGRWHREGCPIEGLLTGWQLEDAKGHADLTDREREFVDASAAQVDVAIREREATLEREKEQAQSRLRWVVAAASAVMVLAAVAVGLGMFSYYQSLTLARLQNLALATAASEDPLIQAGLLGELRDSSRPEELKQFVRLFEGVATSEIPSAVLDNRGADGALIGVRFTNNQEVATVSAGGALRRWSSDGRGSPSAPFAIVPDSRRDGTVDGVRWLGLDLVALSADGTWAAVVLANGAVHVGAVPASDASRTSAAFSSIAVTDSRYKPSAVALDRDGGRLALATEGTIQLWNRDQARAFGPGRTIPGTVPVYALSFDHDRGRLAAATADGVLRIWTLDADADPVVLGPVTLPGVQTPFARSVDFSTDGRWLVAGYSDAFARVWSTSDQGDPVLLGGHTGPVNAVAFAPPRQGSPLTVATASTDKTARLWAVDDPRRVLETIGVPRTLIGHAADVGGLSFSPDGTRLATASADGTTRIWPIDSREPRLIARHRDAIISAEFDAAGARVLTTSWDGTARIVTIDGSKPPAAAVLGDGELVVTAAAFSPDGSRVAAALENGQLVEWDPLTNHREIVADTGGDGRVLRVAYSSDGRRIAAASINREAGIWQVRPADTEPSGKRWTLTHPVSRGGNWVFDIAFDPRDSNRALTASFDGAIRLWSAGESTPPCGEIPFHVYGEASHSGDTRVLRAMFNGQDTVIAASASVVWAWRRVEPSDPCWRRLGWEIRRGKPITDVALGAGNVLLTASDDGTVLLSDGLDGDPLLTLRNGAAVKAVAIEPRGRLVVTGDENGNVRLWRVNVAELAQYLAYTSTACLSADLRRRFLSEGEALARERFEACERYFDRQVP